MNFSSWVESFVYHGSQSPIDKWDSSRHVSGYYPGFYAWPERDWAAKHGKHVYELQIDDNQFYDLKDGDDLKRQAKEAGFYSPASGYQDVLYLKSRGYKGIKRGREYIVFDPEEWSEIPTEV